MRNIVTFSTELIVICVAGGVAGHVKKRVDVLLSRGYVVQTLGLHIVVRVVRWTRSFGQVVKASITITDQVHTHVVSYVGSTFVIVRNIPVLICYILIIIKGCSRTYRFGATSSIKLTHRFIATTGKTFHLQTLIVSPRHHQMIAPTLSGAVRQLKLSCCGGSLVPTERSLM